MAIRIYVQSTIPDSRAEVKKKQFKNLGVSVSKVQLVNCYAIDKKLEHKLLQKAMGLLANPVTEKASLGLETKNKFDWVMEIGFLPGVTDNVGGTAKETLQDGLRVKFKPGENVYSSQVLFVLFEGKNSAADAKKIANSLYNPLIQHADIKSREQFLKDGLDLTIPKVKLTASTAVSKINLDIPEEDLVKLGKLGIKNKDGSRRGPLSLSLEYLKAIKNHFDSLGRNPTDIELETLAQTWSEHCKHTIFADPIDKLSKGIYKTYIKSATEVVRKQKGRKDFCVSVFTDNSGAITFDKDFLITHKVETHNTPSALDPFGGAITGIVGVNRDTLGFGLGAKPVINVYGFCVAEPNDKSVLFRDKQKTQKMLSSSRILEGVVAGVNAGGNQSGIPTNLGFLYFDQNFRGKPLVFAGTVGLIPRQIRGKPSHVKHARKNDLVVMVGGRVGADGIHGATFSSEGLDAHSPATAVQIGDAITQKKFSDAIAKEARGLGLYNAITDCGAGGLSSAVGEMAQTTNGCEIDLIKIPLKYPGLAPWQIWISESQERMVLAVPPAKWKKFENLMKRRGVEATVIGKFTDTGKCVVKFGKQTVLNLDMDFLHNGRPIKQQTTKAPRSVPIHGLQPINRRATDYTKDTLKLLSCLNIASFEFVSKQYDHEVQSGSILKPLQGNGRINAEATVTRPVLTSKKGVVLSGALFPSYSEANPYNMAACAIDAAIRAAVATGADIDYLALLDNFCWCSSEDPKRLWQLKEAARACYDYACNYGTPFISGKDSMFNDFKGFDGQGKPIKISIPPTLLISSLGVIPDISKTVSLEAKMPGDAIYILGETKNELGGSQYLQMLKQDSAVVPTVDAAKNYQLYKNFYSAVQNNLVASAVSVGRGGLTTAIFKTLAGGNLGGEISLKDLPGPWEQNYQALFSESAGRILVTVNPKKTESFEQAFAGTDFARLGRVSGSKIIITDRENKTIVKLKVSAALQAYKEPLKNF